jgi:hypothetical protein
MNVSGRGRGGAEIMRISRQISPTQTVIDQKQLENVA